MFDNIRKRIAKLEETNETFRKTKAHVEKNKTTYLVGAGCLTCGYFLRRPQTITVVSETAPAIAPVFNNMPTIAPVMNNNSSNVVNFGGIMSKIVRRVSDGKMWLSVTEAAVEEGVELSRMSRHLNEHIPHINNEMYEFVGVRTAG